MRVALCFGSYPPERNGGSDFVARLAAALADRGDEVHVLTSGDAAEAEQDGPVTVHRVVRDWRLRGGDLRRADRVLRETGAAVLHVLFPDSVQEASFQIPARLGAGRIPLVTTWWNLGLGPRSPWPLRLESLALLARSRVLTAHEPVTLAALHRVSAGRRVEWLPVGNNLDSGGPLPERDEARREVGLGPHEWLGYFGQLDSTRGVEDLFEALALVRRERDVRLAMIGSAGRPERYRAVESASAHLDAILELPERFGVTEAVRWTDYLPDREVLVYLRAVDLCVLPYRRNSIGRSALAAALEVGVPTILAGDASGVRPLRANEHVALVPSRDPALLARTIERLLDDDGERARLAAGARAGASSFSWANVAERAAAIYAAAVRE